MPNFNLFLFLFLDGGIDFPETGKINLPVGEDFRTFFECRSQKSAEFFDIS